MIMFVMDASTLWFIFPFMMSICSVFILFNLSLLYVSVWMKKFSIHEYISKLQKPKKRSNPYDIECMTSVRITWMHLAQLPYIPGLKHQLMFSDATAKSLGISCSPCRKKLRLRAVLILIRRPAYRWIRLVALNRFGVAPIFLKRSHQSQIWSFLFC